MAHQDAQGNWFYDDGDVDIVDPHGNPLFSTDPNGDGSGGFAGPFADYVNFYLINGTFWLGPSQGPGTPIDQGANPMPFWLLTVVSGNNITLSSELVDGAPSGKVLRATVVAGVNTDEVTVEQVTQVAGSYAQWLSEYVRAVGSQVSGTTTVTIKLQYLKADRVTTTGAEVTAALSGTPKRGGLTIPATGAAPSDAMFMRVRISFKSDGNASVFDLYDIRTDPAHVRYLIAEGTTPATYGAGVIRQDNGVIYIYNDVAGPSLQIDQGGLTATLNSRPGATDASFPYFQVAPTGLIGNGQMVVCVDSDIHTPAGHALIAGAGGYQPFAHPIAYAHTATQSGTGSIETVAAGLGGARAVPFVLSAPMLLQAVTVRSTDTANLRTADWGLYRQNGLSNTLVGIAAGSWSFTPGAASDRSSDLGGSPVFLYPGAYWLVIRNSSTLRVFTVGQVAGGTMGLNYMRSNAAIAALSSTLDISTWTGGSSFVICRLDGRLGAETDAYYN